MSVSTPENPIKRSTKKSDLTISEQTSRLSPQTWAISAVFHVLIFALLIWISPAHQYVSNLMSPKGNDPTKHDREDPQQKAEEQAREEQLKRQAEDPERVAEVVKNINDKQSTEAVQLVQMQLEAEKELNGLLKEKLEDYNQQASDEAVKAPDEVLKEIQTVAQKQQTVLDNQTQLLGKITEIVQKAPDVQNAADPTALDNALKAIAQINADAATNRDAAKQNQIDAATAQETALQKLQFTGLKGSIEAQKAANDAQRAANDAQEKSANAQGQIVDALNKYARGMFGLQDLKAQIAKLQAQIDWRINTDVPNHQAEADKALKKMEDYKKGLAEAKKGSDPVALQNAQFHVDEEQKEIDQTQLNLKYAKDYIGGDKWQLSQLQAQLDDIEKGVADAKANLPGLLANAQSDQQNTQNLQAQAKDKQSSAGTKIAADTQGIDPKTLADGAKADISKFTTAVPDPAGMQGKSLADLYTAARDAESRMTEKYHALKGAELAGIQGITLDEAMKRTEVAKPERESIDSKMLDAEEGNKDLAAYKKAVGDAKEQIESMSDLSNSILANAKNGDKGDKDNIDVSEWLKSAGAALDEAGNDENTTGADIANLMQGKVPPPGPDGGKPSEGEANPLHLTGPKGGLATFGIHGFPRNAPELPGMAYDTLKPLAARKISDKGTRYNDWLYIDTWYLIGPFPNPGRENLNKHFPPETVVDLNAVYLGKNERPIHWVFMQLDQPELRPPNDVEDAPAIYYAYTEIMLDQPRDLWIATGSDDKGTMWINNFPVWNSGNMMKSWEANEGYRKVHFNKGRNRILYRLENAWREAGLSLMISTKQG